MRPFLLPAFLPLSANLIVGLPRLMVTLKAGSLTAEALALHI